LNVGLRYYLLENSDLNECNSTEDEEDCDEEDLEEIDEQNEGLCEENDAASSDDSHSLHSYFLKNKNALTLDVLKKKIAEGEVWIRVPDPICKVYSNGFNL
jgi:hypothetical protein